MGYRLLAWARAANAPDPASRHLLLVLASYANPNGECWPSFDTLVRDTGYHRATVIRKLTVLADLGLITRAKRVGSHGQTTNTYRLLGVAQCDPDTVFGVAQDASRG